MKNEEMKLRTAAAYIRVSTERQEELSPDAQKRLIIDYAKKNNIILNNQYIFIENGISGRKAEKRPEFLKMIGLAKQKPRPFDLILVWKFSRFARNQEESIVYKSLLMKQNHIEVISISEPLADGPFGSLIERIIEWMDEYYSIRLSGEVIRGMTEKALRGGYQSTAPLGYSHIRGSVPEVYEEEAAIVRKIFSLYLEGSDFSSIARKLNESNIRTRRGNPFELRVVKYILQNPFYIGKVRWNRAKHSSYIENPKDEIIIADGKHESIISEKMFKEVQERIAHEFKPTKRHSTVFARHYLQGLLKCPICSSNLTYAEQQKGFNCYKYAKGIHPKSQYLSADKYEKLILEEINDLLLSGNLVFTVKKPTGDNSTEILKLKKELASFDMKEKRIKTAYMDGIDSLEEYKANKKLLEEKRAELNKKLENLNVQKSIPEKSQMLNRIRDVYKVLTSDKATTEEKGNAIRSVVEKIIINKETQSCDFYWYYS